MIRSLLNNNSTDANSINGIPVDATPPPANGDVISYSSTAGQWIYTPQSSGPTGITAMANVGGGVGIFRDITSGPTANLRSIITTTPTNIGITENANNIDIDMNPNPTFGTVTCNQINGPLVLPLVVTPQHTEFQHHVRLDEALEDSSGSAGTSGQVLSSTGSTVSWITPPNIYTANGTLSAPRTVLFGGNNLTFDTTGSVNIFRINAQTVADTVTANTYTANTQVVTPRLRSLSGTVDCFFNDLSLVTGFTGGPVVSFANGLQIGQGTTSNTLEYYFIRSGSFPGECRFISSDSNIGGGKMLNFVGQSGGTTYEQIFSIRNNTEMAMKQLQANWHTDTPVSVVTLDADGILHATDAASTGLGSNIYNSSGVVTVGAGGTRTVGLPSLAHLNITGGYLQNNWTGITSVNPSGDYNSVNCPSDIMADANGNFLAYSNTKTVNSFRIPINVQNLTATNNCIDIMQTTTASNLTFCADVYFSINGFFAVNNYHWKISIPYAANFNQDQWIYYPPLRDDGWQVGSGSDYGLEFYVASATPQIVRMRIRRYKDNGIAFTEPASMTLIRRESDSTAQGSYNLFSQTPYQDNTAVSVVENGTPMHSFQSINDWGEPTSLVFDCYGQRFITFYFSVAAVCTNPGDIVCELYINGSNTGQQARWEATTVGEVAVVSLTYKIDAVKWLFPSPGLLLYGSNTMSVVVSYLAGGTFEHKNHPFQLYVEQEM